MFLFIEVYIYIKQRLTYNKYGNSHKVATILNPTVEFLDIFGEKNINLPDLKNIFRLSSL